ncbi:hypothetical protein O6H91_16G007500 [Diphasiastrum complanatum]|uniref:Uncharacterized protein n=4 Tax=Diphasiastrum complanatum TaxID=34168 RepID=A0ACC2B9Q2_DIPCM|nr:hypothetical protein O6H91_16G007500 [Diphasiastrum complanatum]KAJ7526463.1 hypothetical protein O6H91_16G007500 [Diphasiastrum complanatum]KAJ7526464.1 hypothetical protein O6H91_16G007500 [Diphasiastrum complanatum]KAJ7526469.1 hypothetical protein O6H91_16G007500 [Diphasiastrum complanatum]
MAELSGSSGLANSHTLNNNNNNNRSSPTLSQSSPSHSASASVSTLKRKRAPPPPASSADEPPPISMGIPHHAFYPHSSDSAGNPNSHEEDEEVELAAGETGSMPLRQPMDGANGGGADAEDEDEDDANEDEVEGEDEEEEDQEDEEDEPDSMQQFSAARLEGSARAPGASSLQPLAPVKAEPSTEAPPATQLGFGGSAQPSLSIVKEEPNKTTSVESIQTSGAYCSREDNLKKEEDAGRVKFVCYNNDGVDQHMIWLIGLKNIFSRQLPNMPKEYIVRLVMDRSHKSMMIIKQNQVIGGITYRPYSSQRFGEIAFCAITADEQVKGYGTRLMNHLKQYARDVDGLTHFLTYADNNAVGYFTKQGFTKEIELEKERWQGYIKDYDGGTLMECKIDPKLPYTDLPIMIRRQRQAIDEKIRELSNCHIVYPGLEIPKKDAGVPRRPLRIEDIPGLKEAGWAPDQFGYTRIRLVNATSEGPPTRQSLNNFMRSLLKVVTEHIDSWPFKEPVDGREVPDYYDIIKDPIDLRTISKRLDSEQYFLTLEMFVADMRRMFANARVYNSPETIYYKCANRLESVFMNKLQAGIQASSRPQHG